MHLLENSKHFVEQDFQVEVGSMSEPECDAIVARFIKRMESNREHFLGYQTNQTIHFPNSLIPLLNLCLVNLGMVSTGVITISIANPLNGRLLIIMQTYGD
jgi:hypothetical protein